MRIVKTILERMQEIAADNPLKVKVSCFEKHGFSDTWDFSLHSLFSSDHYIIMRNDTHLWEVPTLDKFCNILLREPNISFGPYEVPMWKWYDTNEKTESRVSEYLRQMGAFNEYKKNIVLSFLNGDKYLNLWYRREKKAHEYIRPELSDSLDQSPIKEYKFTWRQISDLFRLQYVNRVLGRALLGDEEKWPTKEETISSLTELMEEEDKCRI